jgi:hypothetical protein
VETLDTAGCCIAVACLRRRGSGGPSRGEAQGGGQEEQDEEVMKAAEASQLPPLPILASSPAPCPTSQIMVVEVDWWASSGGSLGASGYGDGRGGSVPRRLGAAGSGAGEAAVGRRR